MFMTLQSIIFTHNAIKRTGMPKYLGKQSSDYRYTFQKWSFYGR